MDFKFPINKKDNASYTTEELFDLLAKETTGHYLLGNHNFWHGGIHFTNTSASQCVKDEPIRCIADGEVIAYRINDHYLVSDYMMQRDKNVCTKDDLMLLYSNSFCLVKHQYQSAAKETPKAVDKAENWDDRYFVLNDNRPIRNENTLDDKKCTFKGTLPTNTRLQIREVFNPVKESSFSIARARIVSIPTTNKKIANGNPNAEGNEKLITKTEGDEIFIAAFTKDKQIVTLKSKAKLLKEYTPAESYLNKTFKLNKDIPAKINKTNHERVASDSLSAAMDVNRILSGSFASSNTPSPTATPENKYGLTYETTLPKDIQVQLLTCQGTTANVKITRPVKAKLTTANSTATKEIELAAGEIVTITLFKSDNETIETYTIPAQGKTPAKTAPIATQTTPASDWNDQIIILEKDTKASNDLEPPEKVFFQLPAGTKLQPISTTQPTAQSNYTEAKLLHDVKVNLTESQQYTFREGDRLKVDLFDYYDNLKQPITKTDDPAPLKNTLTFYSLYMHLLPFEEYDSKANNQTETAKKRYVKMTTSLTARDSPSSNGKSLGSIPKNTVFEVLETKEIPAEGYSFAKGNYYLNSNGTKATNTQTVWFATNNTQKSYIEEYTPPLTETQRTQPAYWTGKITATPKIRIDARNAPDANGVFNLSTKKATLNINSEFEFDQNTAKKYKIEEKNAANKTEQKEYLMAECTFKSGTFNSGTLEENEKFWARVDSEAITVQKTTPTQFNDVILCKGIKVKAGDPIGYLGSYQTPKPKTNTLPTTADILGLGSDNPHMVVSDKQQLHLEIFVTDQRELENFIKNKAKLNTGKKYLKLSKGAILTLESKTNTTTTSTTPAAATPQTAAAPTVQPTTQTPTAPAATPTATSYTLKQNHVFALDQLKTKEGTTDTYLITLTEDNQTKTGHIKTDAPQIKTVTQHDWEELGFTIVKENDNNSDGFVDEDNMSPFFKDLYNQLDTNKDGKISKEELQQTLTKTDLRNRWSKLIGYHPTEWQASSSCTAKWSRLDTLLKNNQELLRHEKERIDKLIFWDKVPEIANTPQVCHIHPVAFLEYAVEEPSVVLQSLTAKHPEKIKKIFLHCAATKEGEHYTVDNIRAWHKSQGWSDIGYHYIIYLDGSLNFGRPENIPGSHVLYYNNDSIGVVYVGGLDKKLVAKDTRTTEQKRTLIAVVEALLKRYPNATIHGHREFANKACPSFDVQVYFGKYNVGKTPNIEKSSGRSSNNAF